MYPPSAIFLDFIHTNAFRKTTNQLVFEKQSCHQIKQKTSRRHQRQKQGTTVEKVTHEGEKELTLRSRIIAGPQKRNRTSSLPWKGSVGQVRNIPEDARLPGCKCAVVAIEDSRPTSRDRGEGIALQNVLAPKGGRPSARSSDSWIR